MTATVQRRATKVAPSRKQDAPSKKGADSKKKPQLRLVDPKALRSRARRRRVVMTTFVFVIVGLFVVALFQAYLVQQQQQLDEMRERVATAEAERTRLERDVVMASSPETIVARALELGMVRSASPVYLIAARGTSNP